MTHRELVMLARDLLHRRYRGLESVWPRAIAMLARRALESSIETYLFGSASVRTPFTTQLIVLETRIPPDIARRASITWAGLSRVCHYHGYELPPTTDELRSWIDEVDVVLSALDPEVEGSPPEARVADDKTVSHLEKAEFNKA